MNPSENIKNPGDEELKNKNEARKDKEPAGEESSDVIRRTRRELDKGIKRISKNTFIRRWQAHVNSAPTIVQTREKEEQNEFITIDTENLKALGIKKAMLREDGFIFQAIEKFVNDIYIKQIIEEAITELETIGEKDKQQPPLLSPKFLEPFRPLVDDPEGLMNARRLTDQLLKKPELRTNWNCRPDMEEIHAKICGAIIFRHVTSQYIPKRLMENTKKILEEMAQKFIAQENLAPILNNIEKKLTHNVIMSPGEMKQVVEETYKNKRFIEDETKTHEHAIRHQKMLEEFIEYIAQILKLALLSRATGKTRQETKDWIDAFKSEHPEIIAILKRCKKDGTDWQKAVLEVI